MPERIPPMLASSGSLPARDEGWAYEFKWDGVRAIVYVDNGEVRALTRNDKDLVGSFPELGDIAGHLGSRSAVLDGEIVAFDGEGRPNFGRLQHRLHLGSRAEVERRAREVGTSFLAFDLLYLDGNLLVGLAYDDRRELLESLGLSGASFATPPSFRQHRGADVLEAARQAHLEGVVAKRRSSPYRPGQRGGDWIKIKNFRTQEVVIGGWTEGKGGRAGELGALLLGLPSSDGLAYVGKVGTGFDQSARRELLEILRPREQPASPFAGPLGRSEATLSHFVRPDTVGEVRYAEWTADGHLRHPSWRGLRPDKSPADVVAES